MRRILIGLCSFLFITIILFADNPHVPKAPVVVAQSDNPGQTVVIPPFTLYTPTISGDFRLSTYLEAPNVSGLNALCSITTWTDDVQSESDLLDMGLNTGQPTYTRETLVIHAVAGIPITVGVFNNPTGGCNVPPSYGAFWTLEQL